MAKRLGAECPDLSVPGTPESMNRLRCLPGMVLAALLFLLPQPASAAEGGLRDGDRVLFLGDTFFEREVDYGHLETHITAAYRDRDITFRNLGWAADTPMGRSRASFDWNKSPSDWLKRVKEQIGDFKPTVAVLAYGMTEALELAALPSDAARSTQLTGFLDQVRQLMGAVRELGGADVRFIVVGPLSNLEASPRHSRPRIASRSRPLPPRSPGSARRSGTSPPRPGPSPSAWSRLRPFRGNRIWSISTSPATAPWRMRSSTAPVAGLRAAARPTWCSMRRSGRRTSCSSTGGVRPTGPTSSASGSTSRVRTPSRSRSSIPSSGNGRDGSPSSGISTTRTLRSSPR